MRGTRCSALSRTTTARCCANTAERACPSGSPGLGDTSSADAIVGSTSSGSRTAASGIHHVPPGRFSLRLSATRKARRVFPVPPGPGEGQEPHLVASDQVDDLRQLAATTEKRRRRDGQVRTMQRPERREIGVPDLVEVLGVRNILQPMPPEVAQQAGVVEERSRRRRQDDLSAVRSRSDPRATMHVEAGIAASHQVRRAGVNAHPHADRLARKCLLRAHRCRDRARRSRERSEEGVALRVDFHAAVALECVAEDRAMALQLERVRLGSDCVEPHGRSPRCRRRGTSRSRPAAARAAGRSRARDPAGGSAAAAGVAHAPALSRARRRAGCVHPDRPRGLRHDGPTGRGRA